jgi:hypothetical protein
MFDRRATSCKAKAGREKLGNGSEGALEWIVLEHLKFHGDFDHTKVEKRYSRSTEFIHAIKRDNVTVYNAT